MYHISNVFFPVFCLIKRHEEPLLPARLWISPSLLSKWNWGLFPWGLYPQEREAGHSSSISDVKNA